MAQWNQFGSLLSRLNSGDARDLQGIAFRKSSSLSEQLYRCRRHLDECFGAGNAHGLAFSCYIDHARAALLVDVRQFTLF